jgi:hypothetical protein
MKAIRRNLKKIAVVLMILMSLQSCSVYYAKTATIDEALNSSDKVKIKSPDDAVYKFEKLTKVEEELYGLAKKKSQTAKQLNDQIIWKKSDSKNVSILLTDKNISSVHLKNKSGSTMATIAIPVVTLGILAIIGFTAADNISVGLDGI